MDADHENPHRDTGGPPARQRVPNLLPPPIPVSLIFRYIKDKPFHELISVTGLQYQWYQQWRQVPSGRQIKRDPEYPKSSNFFKCCQFWIHLNSANAMKSYLRLAWYQKQIHENPRELSWARKLFWMEAFCGLEVWVYFGPSLYCTPLGTKVPG